MALNCCVPEKRTLATNGETETTTPGRIVTVADADFDGSATETAVIVTELGFGTTAGAK